MGSLSRGDAVQARAHWSIYLPTFVIAVSWGAFYLWADAQEPALEGLRALAGAVVVAGVPLLLGHAWMRARTARFEVEGGRLSVRSGWPVTRALHADLRDVAAVSARRSRLQKRLGAGTLDVRFADGRSISLADVAEPDTLAEEVMKMKQGGGNAA